MTDFHEVRFPLRLALQTSGGPVRRTDIVRLSNGRENRNARWRDARRRYDVGSAVKTLDDLYKVIAFFEARAGELHGFRFSDPVDHKSTAPSETVGALDQELGIGDGETAAFQLLKTYGDAGGSAARTIQKPVSGSVVVAVAGTAVSASLYSVDTATGIITFGAGAVPAIGDAVTAGFQFDVPVRFDIDRIDISLTAFKAGQIPSIPLVEIKP